MKHGLSIAQVAKQIGVSYRTLKRRVDEGIIPAKSYGPKTTRIDRAIVNQLKAHGINGLASSIAHGYPHN